MQAFLKGSRSGADKAKASTSKDLSSSNVRVTQPWVEK